MCIYIYTCMRDIYPPLIDNEHNSFQQPDLWHWEWHHVGPPRVGGVPSEIWKAGRGRCRWAKGRRKSAEIGRSKWQIHGKWTLVGLKTLGDTVKHTENRNPLVSWLWTCNQAQLGRLASLSWHQAQNQRGSCKARRKLWSVTWRGKENKDEQRQFVPARGPHASTGFDLV